MQNIFTWSKAYNLLNSLTYPVYPYSQGAMNCWKKSKTAIIQTPENCLDLSGDFSISTEHTEYSQAFFPRPIQELQMPIGPPSFLSRFPLLLAELLLSRLIFFPALLSFTLGLRKGLL